MEPYIRQNQIKYFQFGFEIRKMDLELNEIRHESTLLSFNKKMSIKYVANCDILGVPH